jgi:hypothetical protein
MSSEAQLLERIEKLRDALVHVRDRDPEHEHHHAADIATYASYTEEIRHHAMRALQVDDALAAVKRAG